MGKFRYWCSFTFNKLVNIIDNPYISKIQLMSAVSSFLWGLWVLLPFDTFGTEVGYATVQKLAPEPIWGFLMCFLGLLQLASLILEDHPIWREVREYSNLFSFIGWTALFSAFILSGATTTLTPIFLTFVLFSFLAYRHS